ncbi:PepSY-associated TM helix domain-containing protein [Paracidovorax wautersii]|uniref:Iron-regulated membrane protein n=1 Tax=Paracidovorax wautersii TaxID=1177982 RepID=A0ABU1IB86_9BURK|nr:PepSY-associated TM helix domain-containing protein [Paracidovorax wautersii]MDR6214486.1 putative iron-regulated membrane protein [Paracidovorax wautersii]
MKEGFRQSMAWLHTWSGLLVGWVLFMVFATGTSAYFRDEISRWMKPELHQSGPATHADAALSAAKAQDYLQAHAQGSNRWTIRLPDGREPGVSMFWPVPQAQQPAAAAGGEQRPRRARFENATIDPATGARVEAPRQTRGGDFFYRLHFDLHYMPAVWARWIVGFCAMFMLVAIVSGIVTHKRIFKDFFTFRPKKGQRSWLDAHNATAVLALPYHLMITYTGLVTLMFLYMPWGPQAAYQGDEQAFFAEVFPNNARNIGRPSGTAAPLVPLGGLVRQASEAWGGQPVARITVSNPGDTTARVTLFNENTRGVSSKQASMVFDGATGALLERRGEVLPAASETHGVLYGLHIARFSNPFVRWLFFLSGLAGTVMVATGLLLWAVKERQKYAKALAKGGRIGWGLRLVDGLNVAAVAGLPLAMAAFFWANRLIPAGLADRSPLEITCFFTAWGAAAVAGIAWPARRMWQAQLAIGGLLFALLPVLNPLTGGAGLWTALPQGLWAIAGFDLTALGLGLALLACAWWIGKRKPASKGTTRPAAARPAAREESSLTPQAEPGLATAHQALQSTGATP